MKTVCLAALRPRHLLPVVLCVLLAAGAAQPRRASAAFVFTIAQTGANVTVTGSGTLNTTALTLSNTTTLSPSTMPAGSQLYSGPLSSVVDRYTGINAPPAFGDGFATTNATSGTGNFVGVAGFIFSALDVPTGYVSGSPLADTSTYANATVSGLGFTPGTYTVNWGSGATADTLVVNIVPEPSTWALLVVGAGALGLALRRRHVRRA